MANGAFLLCLVASGIALAAGQIPVNYTVKWYTQRVDHQSYSNNDVFQQRYIISDVYWKPNGPIWFYAGNEGDVFSFANNTGFMWEHASKFGALIVFMEHRYYGETLPYGKNSFSGITNLGYLTVEQALLDYATFIEEGLKSDPKYKNSPVVVFGGSYGGMLAAWLRMKYPHVVVGALAASAPILQFPGIYDCEKYYEVITKNFEDYSPLCSSSIRNSWKAIRRVAQTEEGLAWLTNQFQLCKPLKKEKVDDFVSFIVNAWDSMSMTDYPNPANFLQPLPAYPIKVACKYMTTPNADDRALIKTIYDGVSVFYNYTGAVKCNDIGSQGGGLGDIAGWDFQACTEMVLPACSNGVKDMFEVNPWNLTKYSLDCKKKYGVYSDKDKALILFGGDHIKAASNIIFSNGLRDQWSAGGVLETLNPTLPAIKIAGACHHEDLRPSGPNDPQNLKDARQKELSIIRGWLDDYYKERNIVHNLW